MESITIAVTNTTIGTPPGVVAGNLAGPSPIKAGQVIMLKIMFANVLSANTTVRVDAVNTVLVELGPVLLTIVVTSLIARTSCMCERIVARAPRRFADALTAGVEAVSAVRAWQVIPVLVSKSNALSEQAIS